ncbi:DUF4956 domain-containing protein [bacterium]|nr:DUF4956 domain-containing protein [bacterium]
MPIETDILQWATLAMSPTTWLDAVLNLVVALVSAAIINFIYRQCRGLHTSRSFVQTLYMLTLIICMIMMIIMGVRGTSAVAVAFGLMGALSLIRFRTIVKDNRDTAFVFLSVGAGMAAGTGMWWIGFAGLAVIGLVLLFHQNAPWQSTRQRVIAKVTIRPKSDDFAPGLLAAFAQLGDRIQMLHLRTIRMGEMFENTYEFTLFPTVTPAYAIQELMKVDGVDNVNIFNPEELEEP